MIQHIVKNNENINDIMQLYSVSLEEIRVNNSHITDFNNLLSGTKILVPLLTQEVEQILNKTECFVMDYYPKISDDLIPQILDDKEDEIESHHEINKRAYPGILPPKNPYKGV